jgi:hypothetical protein
VSAAKEASRLESGLVGLGLHRPYELILNKQVNILRDEVEG